MGIPEIHTDSSYLASDAEMSKSEVQLFQLTAELVEKGTTPKANSDLDLDFSLYPPW